VSGGLRGKCCVLVAGDELHQLFRADLGVVYKAEKYLVLFFRLIESEEPMFPVSSGRTGRDFLPVPDIGRSGRIGGISCILLKAFCKLTGISFGSSSVILL
jgi:hypothetical protein